MDARTGLPVVGMVGGGQLARMTHQAAIALGQSLHVLAESPDDAAALVASEVTIGDYRDVTVLGSFADGCDVLTWDHEHVPNEHVRTLDEAGIAVHPGPDALRYAQDKIAMRRKLTELGIACPRWVDLTKAPDPAGALDEFARQVGWPLVLKAARGGYDGKGVWVVADALSAASLIASGTPLLAEEMVAISRELAADVARSPYGQAAAWPVVETVQRDGVCVEVFAPAPHLPDELADEAQQIALRIASELDVTGLLAVELFETTDERLLVNELAMRPHNSAHWTIEGARTSQFEQHLRAVLDYPLGTTTMTAPVVVMANLLAADGEVDPPGIDERVHHCMAKWPDVKIHLYGKQFRPGRKVGHVTALGSDLTDVRTRALAAADFLMNGTTTR
ncbi:MAG TPA: 5-(carboxyamino)imidazole ribonucleotide synthase [Jatrophihabitantaceae bacterium]|nr:5-(carboxyamino)imidazole ribonucleotide synthase [Jatrophihabitantaceae bacterium]